MNGSPAQRPRRVIVISPTAALASPSTAGGILLSRIVESHLASGALVTVLTPSLDAALAELDRTSPLTQTRFLGRPRDYLGFHRLMLTLAHRAQPTIRRWDRSLPAVPFAVDLLMNRKILRLLRSADVIDLQWEEYGRMAGLLRRLAPRATLLCTFHDVNSQRLEREAERFSDTASQREAEQLVIRARRTERRILSSIDTAFVLSEKDEQLLRGRAPTDMTSAPVTVIRPPLVTPDTPLADVNTRPPVVGFVSFLRRFENRDAALRLAEQIWPRVRAAVPGAKLVIVGGGIEEDSARRLTAVPGVELMGFVEDLESAYDLFHVTVSPIDRGAGVKFKVIESIVRGIPTITTSVGAEGIDPSLFTAVADADEELVEHTISALLEDGRARAALDAAHRARALYGVETFRTTHQRAVGSATRRRPTFAAN